MKELATIQQALKEAQDNCLAIAGELKAHLKDLKDKEQKYAAGLAAEHSEPVEATADLRNLNSVDETINILKSFPLFSTFTDHILQKLAGAAYELRRRTGDVIVNKGDEAAEMFFLTKGSVGVVHENSIVSLLQPGDFFGELGILFSLRRTASVICQSDCELLVLTKQKILEISSTDSLVKAKMHEWSNNKEIWWKRQKYSGELDHFGGEFVGDIARQDIRKISFFTNAPDTFIDKLAMEVKSEFYEKGSTIIYANADSDSIFFNIRGHLLVVGSSGTVHAEIAAGSVVGEIGAIMNMKRVAKVIAKDDCYLLKLTRESLFEVLSGYPDLQDALKKIAEERYSLYETRSRIKSRDPSECALDLFDVEISEQSLFKLEVLQGIPAEFIRELAFSMVRKNWEPNNFIIKCGEMTASIFFLAAGEADVISEFGEIIDKCSGPSSYFGEVSLFENVPRTASIRSKTNCSTFELKREDFLNLIDRYPQVGKTIQETSKLRMQKYLMRSILA
ncbi:hypothetical protein HDU97_007746 [Phlyctochytrium planicorne]|nr:hypothetical protein HDU97_007746 [Phlyctochytrium planicorne]